VRRRSGRRRRRGRRKRISNGARSGVGAGIVWRPSGARGHFGSEMQAKIMVQGMVQFSSLVLYGQTT
jgi:hypothetical protein